MSLPTDHMHKFFAVLGFVLIGFSVNSPWHYYNESELKRIDALESMRLMRESYSIFARDVNAQIELYNSVVNELDEKRKEKVFSQIMEMNPDTEESKAGAYSSLVKMQKNIDLMEHYSFVSNVWFFIAIASFVLGGFFSSWGFWRWIVESREG